jgi:hypothetical protein
MSDLPTIAFSQQNARQRPARDRRPITSPLVAVNL